jgi:hypothetical protein
MQPRTSSGSQNWLVSAIRLIPSGAEIWRPCFASLAVNSTPVRNEAANLFAAACDGLLLCQTAGIRDGASHCAKILSGFYDNLDTRTLVMK